MNLTEAVREVIGRRVMVWHCGQEGDHEPHILRRDDRWIYQCLGTEDI